jgi:hypothetical protein
MTNGVLLNGTLAGQYQAIINLLHLNPDINYLSSNTQNIAMVRGFYYNPVLTNLAAAKHIAVETTIGDVLFNTVSGNVGIGTNNPSEKLSVNGNIVTKKVRVTQTGWADYVFDKAYKLPTLREIEQYIQKYKHLPEVPTSQEVQEKGVDVGNTQVLLLKKVEELTLYLIQQNKEIEQLKKELNELKKGKKN